MGGVVGGSKVHCLVACCPGNKVGSSTGELCTLADQWNLCVCLHARCVCVSPVVGRLQLMRIDRTKRKRKQWWVIRCWELRLTVTS